MQVRTYAKNNSVALNQLLETLKGDFGGDWTSTSKLTDQHTDYLNNVFKSYLALPPQEERKALPQAQTEQPQAQTEQPQAQTEQVPPQPQEEQQTVNNAPAPIQTSNNNVALTQSDLAAIATIRETFGEQGVQVFLQKKRQDLIVNRATSDALRQHDEQKLYEEVKLSVQNQLQIRDYIQEQQALDMAITQHTQLKAQRKEKIQKSNEAFDTQLSEFLTKQQDFNATMELLGISML